MTDDTEIEILDDLLNIRFPRDLADRIRQDARSQHRNYAQQVRWICEQHYQRQPQEKAG